MKKFRVTPLISASKQIRKILKAALCAFALSSAFTTDYQNCGLTLPLCANETASDNWIYLDGSQSSDDYGANLQYRWRQVGGTRVILEHADTAKPRFIPPTPGTYAFELVVSNGEASSKPALVEIEVDPANTPPEAVLPAKLSLTLGENLILDGSHSHDADNDQLTYHWRQIAGTALLSEVAARQSRRAPVITLKPASAGIYEFELTVSDGRETSMPERCRVEVTRPISVPVARVSAPRKAIVKFSRPAAKNMQPAVNSRPAENIRPAEIIRPAENSRPADNNSGSLEDIAANLPQISEPEALETTSAPQNTQEKLLEKPQAAAPVARITAPKNNPKIRRAVPALSAEEITPRPAPETPQPITAIDHAAQTLAEEMAESSENMRELTPIADITPVRTPQLRVTPVEKNTRPRIKMMPAARRENPPSPEMTALKNDLNVAPVAAIKGNVTAETGQKVLLEGIGTDVDGDPITYSWRQTAGPVIPGNPGNKKNIAFIPQEAGVYIFELTVSDGKAASEPAACAVTVVEAENDTLAKNSPRDGGNYNDKRAKIAQNGSEKNNRKFFWK